MSNPWIGVARVLIPLEGLAGMIFNLLLIFYLARTNIGRDARLYYYSSIVTAICNFFTALFIFLTVDLPTIADGHLIAMYYGPLLFYFPKWANDVICVAFFSILHTMWQMIPAPSILQWFALSKSNLGELTKMLVAYALPVTFNVITWIEMPGFLPSDQHREEVFAIAERIYGINRSEFHVFTIPVQDKNKYDAIDLGIYDLVPSFLVSYTLFAISAYKIRGKISSLGASISEKTKQMQRRFLRTQIAQVLLPLILMSIPLGTMCAAAFLGRELHNLPFLIGYLLWPAPMFTALLLLAFVRKTAQNATPVTSKMSLSKVSKISVHGKTSTSIGPRRNF